MAIAVGAARIGNRLAPTGLQPLDLRFAAAGALVPDLADKPLAWFVMPSLPDDHLLGHTIWLPLLLMLGGAFINHRRGGVRMFLLGLGAFTHLIVDPVNAHPRTLFWPLFGATFPDVRGYLFVLPICIEAVLTTSLLVAMQRSGALRQRASAFVRSGVPFL